MIRGNRFNGPQITQDDLRNSLAKSQDRQLRPEFRQPFNPDTKWTKRSRTDRSDSRRSTPSTATPPTKKSRTGIQPLPKGPRELAVFQNFDLGPLKVKLRETPAPLFPLPDPKLRKKFDTDSIVNQGFMVYHIEDVDELILFANPLGQVFPIKNFKVPDFIKILLEDPHIAKIGYQMQGRMIEILCEVEMVRNLWLDSSRAECLVPIFKPQHEDEVMPGPRDAKPDLYPLAVHNVRKLIWLFWANVTSILPKPVMKEDHCNIAPRSRLLYVKYGSQRFRASTHARRTGRKLSR